METLIVSGGDINIEYLKQYIPKYQNIIAVDKGLETLYKLKIMPNHVVGDFDSINQDILKLYQKNPKIIFHKLNVKKDNTDTDIALNLAINLNSSKIVIVGALGKRMDHTLANIHILKEALNKKIQCYLLDEYNKIYLTQNNLTLYKNKTYGKYISLIPMTTTVEGLTLIGFKYCLKDAILSIGKSLGISNEIEEEVANIKFKKGILIVIESRD